MFSYADTAHLSCTVYAVIVVAFYTAPALLSAMKAYLAFQEHVDRGEKVTKEEVGRAAIQVEKNIISKMNNKNIKILLERLESFPEFPREKIPEFDLTDDDPFSPLTSLVDDKEKKPGMASMFWSVMRQMLWPLMFYFGELF